MCFVKVFYTLNGLENSMFYRVSSSDLASIKTELETWFKEMSDGLNFDYELQSFEIVFSDFVDLVAYDK